MLRFKKHIKEIKIKTKEHNNRRNVNICIRNLDTNNNNNNLDWVQFRALPPGSTAASVAYFTIPRFLNVPTLAARCLSRPQPAVAP